MKKVLFIHFGPGGNCEIERKWFTQKYPHIEFWDQPPAKNFAELYHHLKQKLQDYGKLKLIAHSFGCELAKELINNHPNKIESATLLAPCPRLPEAFFRLATKLLQDPNTPKNVQKELPEILEHFNSSPIKVMWELVGTCAKDPSYQRLFFSNQEIMEQYFTDAAQAKPIDTETWQSVISDFLTNKDPSIPLKIEMPIKIYLGKEDPYSAPEEDKLFLQGIYPTAKIELLDNSGHLLHFEQSETTLS